jgi:hypothetical protein
MAIKQTATYEPYAGYTTYEGSDFPGFDWTFNEEQGGWTKPTPNPNTPSQFSLEDIKNRSGYAFDPNQDKLVTDSADESLSPSAYYNKLAKDLSEASYGVWSINGNPSQYTELIEGLKEVDPKAYYTAKIDTLSRGIGHQYQSNQMARGDVVKQQLQDILPEAKKAGLTSEEINSLYGSGYSQGAQGFAQILQGQQSAGGPYTPLWEGIKFVGPGALGMYGIDQALIAGLGAAYGAGTGLSSVGIGSGLGTAAALEGGALAAGAGSLGAGGGGLAGLGAIDSTAAALGGSGGGGLFTPTAGSSFAIAPEAVYGLANATTPLTTTEISSLTGFTPTAGNSFTIDPSAVYTTAGNITSNPVTQEMIDFANARPDPIQAMSEMQNMTTSELATALGPGAGTELLSNVGGLLKGAQLAKGLLGVGKNPLQPQSLPQQQMQGGRQYAGVDYSPILNLFNVQQPQRNRNSLLG